MCGLAKAYSEHYFFPHSNRRRTMIDQWAVLKIKFADLIFLPRITFAWLIFPCDFTVLFCFSFHEEKYRSKPSKKKLTLLVS